ncbi:MAG TPA: Ig-like domain-containing protein [Thermoanaerobaculia bacterium]|nr:Ig-like domain-containing protein [Thermoanaerobaculia bacterium]
MQRKAWFLAFGLTVVFAGVAAAAPPFGSFGGLVTGGNSTAGVASVHGWALDDNGVFAVDIVVDGQVAGRALYGRARPGVTLAYPSYPDSAAPGYGFELDTTRYLNGNHTVTARVTSLTGEVRQLNSVTLEFLNVTHNLVPFGRVEFPNSDAELFGNCNPLDPNRRYSVFWGYALDVGVERGDQGVAYVQLLIDGVLHADTLINCRYDIPRGGYTDCYGLPRLDLTRFFPTLSDSPHSGFRFVLDVGDLIALERYTPGRHLITIRAGDRAGQVSNIHDFPVTFTCFDFVGNDNSFGAVDRPRGGLIYSGIVEAIGWALDLEGVHDVVINVDGFPVGDAERGFVRPGVTNLYPGYLDSATPGWRFFLDTTLLSDGEHFFQVLVRDNTGAETIIGERRFGVYNP